MRRRTKANGEKQIRRHQFSPRRSLTGTNKTTVENKLTEAALLLSYQFEYGINFEQRIINITGDIEEFQFDLVDAALTQMEKKNKKDVTIKINSEGGSPYQAMAIVGRIKEAKKRGVHVVTKGYGAVMSAACIILAAGTRRRELSSDAAFMWHESSYGMEGRHSQNMALVKQMEKEEKYWAERMAELSKKDAKFWREKGANIDAYFTAEQLQRMGVVDDLF